MQGARRKILKLAIPAGMVTIDAQKHTSPFPETTVDTFYERDYTLR